MSSSGQNYSPVDVSEQWRDASRVVSRLTRMDISNFPVEPMRYVAPVMDAETRNLVARLRGPIYNQRGTNEAKENRDAAAPAGKASPYAVDDVRRGACRFGIPPAKVTGVSKPSQKMPTPGNVASHATANNNPGADGNDGTDARSHAPTAAGMRKVEQWQIVLTAGVGDEEEGENGFMTLECEPPAAAIAESRGKNSLNSNAVQFDSTTIMQHLTLLISPLSYVIRAVFYYDCDFASYMLLTADTARYAGCKFRVFVVPENSSQPLRRRNDKFPSAIAPSQTSCGGDVATATVSGIPGPEPSPFALLPTPTMCTTCALGTAKVNANIQSRKEKSPTYSLRHLPPTTSSFTESNLSIINQLQMEIQADLARLKSIAEGVGPSLPRKKNCNLSRYGDSQNQRGKMEEAPSVTTTVDAPNTSIAPHHHMHPPEGIYRSQRSDMWNSVVNGCAVEGRLCPLPSRSSREEENAQQGVACTAVLERPLIAQSPLTGQQSVVTSSIWEPAQHGGEDASGGTEAAGGPRWGAAREAFQIVVPERSLSYDPVSVEGSQRGLSITEE